MAKAPASISVGIDWASDRDRRVWQSAKDLRALLDRERTARSVRNAVNGGHYATECAWIEYRRNAPSLASVCDAADALLLELGSLLEADHVVDAAVVATEDAASAARAVEQKAETA